MGGMLHSLLERDDRVLDGTPTLWDSAAGRVGPVIVDVRRRPIRPVDVGRRLRQRPGFRERFKSWLRASGDKDERSTAC